MYPFWGDTSPADEGSRAPATSAREATITPDFTPGPDDAYGSPLLGPPPPPNRQG